MLCPGQLIHTSVGMASALAQGFDLTEEAGVLVAHTGAWPFRVWKTRESEEDPLFATGSA